MGLRSTVPVLIAASCLAAAGPAPDRRGCVALERLGQGTCRAKVSCATAAPLEKVLRRHVAACTGAGTDPLPTASDIARLTDMAGGETALACCLAIPLFNSAS